MWALPVTKGILALGLCINGKLFMWELLRELLLLGHLAIILMTLQVRVCHAAHTELPPGADQALRGKEATQTP